MINITLWQNQNQEIVKFLIEGHAGYDDEGFDIVCSAISALTIGTLNGLTEYVSIPVDIDMKDGYTRCILPDNMTNIQTVQSQAILKTMELAFENIQEVYNKYVNMNRKKL